jgi:hypothetical protein
LFLPCIYFIDAKYFSISHEKYYVESKLQCQPQLNYYNRHVQNIQPT